MTLFFPFRAGLGMLNTLIEGKKSPDWHWSEDFQPLRATLLTY